MLVRVRAQHNYGVRLIGISRHPLLERALVFTLLALTCAVAVGCRQPWGKKSVRPRSLRDVPAERLAYRFDADTNAPPATGQDPNDRLQSVQNDFDTRRKDDALVRTVLSPDRQRALALYETGDVQPGEFRIDLYGVEGNFLRNVTPPELSGAFAPTVSWSPDGSAIAFIGRKSIISATPTPTPPEDAPQEEPSPPEPGASVAPLFAPVPVFGTEQIYVCNRDGYELKPLTTREGLIYFYFVWAPDSHAVASLACREDEWETRDAAHLVPAGRPRLIEASGQERLLDDALAAAPPVWSPDSSKVATAFETSVGIYDAITSQPTAARIQLREPLLVASAAYDEKKLGAKNKREGTPVSFNPVVRLEWLLPETLFIQTGFVRKYPSETVTNFMRWHALHLSPQAALLSGRKANFNQIRKTG
ncbi:MAG TPA: hypothetical protein VF708_14425 [Pyrinomonadaceae bacterium]|jgi:hypothetical protein